MPRVFALILTALFLISCNATVKAPDAQVKLPGVEIELQDDDSTFCPPGQAKKGRC